MCVCVCDVICVLFSDTRRYRAGPGGPAEVPGHGNISAPQQEALSTECRGGHQSQGQAGEDQSRGIHQPKAEAEADGGEKSGVGCGYQVVGRVEVRGLWYSLLSFSIWSMLCWCH